MSHIQIEIQVTESIQGELIYLLDVIDYNGFEQDDNKLIAYIDEENFDAIKLELLLNKYDLKYSKSIIEKQNWNQLWESNFDPVVVDDFVAIRAHFHQPIAGVKKEILITPKMSFGTGHHATTYMVIQLMAELEFENKKVLDFGTGTGVLAILAEQLGAAVVLATDYDDWCIENSEENISNNNCKVIDIHKNDSLNIDQQFDIILANINRNILLDNLDGFAKISMAGTQLLLSGFLQNDETDMVASFKSIGFNLLKKKEKNGWIALLLQR